MPRVLVPLAQGCEELEAVTIIDLLRRAGIEVVTAGLDDNPVTASRGVKLIPDTSIQQVENDDFDMLVLPGGQPGSDHLANNEHIIKIIQRLAEKNRFISAICAAPRVLARAGVLDGKRATCYPGSLDSFELSSTDITNESVVIDGKIVTSRGPGTAMDFALTLIEQLVGTDAKSKVEDPLCRPS